LILISVIVQHQVTWFDAESLCISRGLQLASIDDETEFNYIKNQLVARGLQNSQVWIGGTEIGAEDNYYWTNTGNAVDYAGWDDTEIVAVANRQVETLIRLVFFCVLVKIHDIWKTFDFLSKRRGNLLTRKCIVLLNSDPIWAGRGHIYHFWNVENILIDIIEKWENWVILVSLLWNS